MEQQILCENKSFKLFILFKNGIDTNTSAKIMFCLIMSKLILVQNNHFSKVCTVFCLINTFKKSINITTVIKMLIKKYIF